MTALVFILTLLVGFFIGVSTAVGAALYLTDKKSQKESEQRLQRVEAREETSDRVNVDENSFVWPSQTPE